MFFGVLYLPISSQNLSRGFEATRSTNPEPNEAANLKTIVVNSRKLEHGLRVITFWGMGIRIFQLFGAYYKS